MSSLILFAADQPHGPSLYHLLEVLGKEKTLERIERAIGNAGFGE